MPAEAIRRISEEKTGSGLEQEAGFAERRDALFEKIAEGSKDDFSQRMRAAIVGRVFEHSIEDGMRLAERISLTPKAYQYAVLSLGSAVKHPDVYWKIQRLCSDHTNGPIQNFSDEMVEMLRVFQSNRERLDDLKFDQNNRLMADPTRSFYDYEKTRGENSAFKEVDDLYASLVATQGPLKIGGSKALHGQSKGVRIGEKYLEYIEPVLAKSYYTGPIKDRFPGYRDWHSLKGPTIDEDELRAFLRTANLPEQDILEQLKPARVVAYAQIDAAERGAAKGELLKELRKTLPEGMKVELDGKTNAYQIVEDADVSREEKEAPSEFISEEKALDELEKLLDIGANPDSIAQFLTGLDSPRAWNLRKRLLKAGVLKLYIMRSLAGVDSREAWNMRELLLGQEPGLFMPSLIGLDTRLAWELREKLFSNSVNEKDVAHYLIGLDSQKAWVIRERLLVKYPNQVAESLIGLDSPEAWDMRRRLLPLLKSYPDPVVRSLAGLDSQKAWEMRERLFDKVDEDYVALSLVGLDSQKAWEMRERLLKEASNRDSVALSLAGLGSLRAQEMRERLLKEGVAMLNVAAGINGEVRDAIAWRMAKNRKEEAQKAQEKKKTATEFKSEWQAIEELRKLLYDGATTESIAESLVGFDSPDAWEFRRKLEKKGAPRDALMRGLAGTDSPESWDWRNRLLGQGAGHAAESMIGLDTPQAWASREKLLSSPSAEKNAAHCLIGLDSPKAWEMRERLMTAYPHDMAESLAGLDSPKAWEMRERLMKIGADMGYVVGGLAGIDSHKAWEIREDQLEAGHVSDVLKSLVGIDSDRAWEIREHLADNNSTFVALSLAGLDSPKARTMRERLLKDGKASEAIAFSINGDVDAAIAWRLAKKREEEDAAKVKTSVYSDALLELLNAVHDPSREKIRDFRKHWGSKKTAEEKKKHEREAFERSGHAAKILTDRSKMDRGALQEYLSLNPAVPDRNPDRLADELFRRMAPSAQPKRPLWERFKSVLPFGRGEGRAPVSAGVEDLSTYELHGGGGEELADKRLVLEARDEIHDLLVTGAYGSYDKKTRQWEKVYFPVSRTVHEPTRETTLTIQDVAGTGRAVLPKPLTANLIVERVKGITAKGKEVPLVPVVNSLGEASVEIPKNIQKLGYSIEVPLAPPPMADVDQRGFEQFAKSFTKQYGKGMTERLGQLPHDVAAELRSRAFIALSPKAKVQRIEEMCRELGYYDTKNEEMSADKRGKSPEEQIAICEERMEKLRRTQKDPAMAKKKFAGVCADYALISCAMLRASGIPAGILSGFGMNGKEARMNQSHATAFVPWPDGHGGIRMVVVDGTPGSDDPRVMAAARPMIGTLEQQATKDMTAEIAEAKEVIERLLEAAKAGDEEAIRKLTNGKLENALNIILRYEVKRPHLQGVTRMLEAYWYGGIQRLDRNVADIEMRKFMEDAIVRGREGITSSEEPAGTQLLETVRTFLTKFEKGGAVSSRAEGFKLLDRIAGLAKGELGEVERRALAAVITYLKAKKIQ